MASRMMHLAMATEILAKHPDLHRQRFLLGSLLPDALRYGPSSRGQSHLLRLVCQDTKHTYDLTAFRARYGERLLTDGLYLGYYLHLVQDICFRRFMCQENLWRPAWPSFVQQLHQDYRQLNGWIAGRYQLSPADVKAVSLQEEPLADLYPFDMEALIRALQEDFHPMQDQPLVYFTRERTAQYLKQAIVLSLDELQALRTGAASLDETELAWPVSQ